MTEKILYMELFQPFAQYRNLFTFYYAQSYPLPPKSTVVGMLQNATERYYDPKFWELSISVHGGFESVFWNYQQLIKGFPQLGRNKKGELYVINQNTPLYNEGIKSQRTPVHQQELFNGHLYIFVRGEETILLEIQKALEHPKLILSLGRSEDIIFIRNIRFVEPGIEKEVKKSLWLTYPTYIRKEIIYDNNEKEEFPIKNQKYPVYSIPVFITFYNDDAPIKNKAEITKKTTRREVKFETVIYTGFDYVVKLSKSVSYEEFQIDGKKFRIISEFGWL